MRTPAWFPFAISFGITTLLPFSFPISALAESQLTGIRLDPQEHVLLLSVNNGSFDPILHMERNERGEYRVLIEGENVQFDSALQHDALALTEEFTRLMPEISAVNLFQVTQNDQPAIKIILDSKTKIIPQIRTNSESQITIALVIETASASAASKSSPTVAKPAVQQSSYLSLTQSTTLPTHEDTRSPFSVYQLGLDLDTPEPLQKAWKAFRTGDADNALEQIAGYLQSKPNDPAAHLLRSQIYQAQSKKELATQELEKLLAVDSHFLPARLELITLQLAGGNYTQSERLIQEGEIQSPNHPELLYSKGLLLEALGSNEQARIAYLKALAESPYNLFYHYRLAMTELKNNNPKAARFELQRVLLHSPDDAEALKLMGFLAQKDNDPDTALHYYQKALRPDVLINYATLLHQQKQTEAALAILKTAELMAPDDPEIQYNLGMLYVDYKLKKLAEKPLSRFLNLTPDPNDPRIPKAKASLKEMGFKQLKTTIGNR